VAPIDGKEYADHRKPKSAMRLLAKISHTLMNRRTATSGAEASAEVKH
jgi:retron-type reverse transcriptase